MHMQRARIINPRQRLKIQEDCEKPISVVGPEENVPVSVMDRQDLLLQERALQGRRVAFRFGVEVYGRSRAKSMTFHRLPNSHVLFSCPTPAQARAAIKLIQRVCESLDGKFLAEDDV